MTSHPRCNRDSTTGMTVTGQATRLQHISSVGFNHAERFSLAKVGCFAAGRMFVRRDRDAMLMVFCIVGIVPSRIFLVIRSVGGVLPGIPGAPSPALCRCLPFPDVVSSCCSCSLVSPVTSICTAGRFARSNVTVSLPPVFPTFEPSALPPGLFYFHRCKSIATTASAH